MLGCLHLNLIIFSSESIKCQPLKFPKKMYIGSTILELKIWKCQDFTWNFISDVHLYKTLDGKLFFFKCWKQFLFSCFRSCFWEISCTRILFLYVICLYSLEIFRTFSLPLIFWNFVTLCLSLKLFHSLGCIWRVMSFQIGEWSLFLGAYFCSLNTLSFSMILLFF